jgi:hypothetical protein
MTKFASETIVSPERTLAEIQTLIKKYGCDSFGFMQQPTQVGIAFEMRNRRVRFTLPLPNPTDEAFLYTPEKHIKRTTTAAREAYEQGIRSRWRALLLTIKAKLESVESGIETFEEAFMAQIVLPSGQTMSEWAIPQIAAAYQNKDMPPLLPG